MSLMTEMNNYARLTEARPVSASLPEQAAAILPLYGKILAGLPAFADGGWEAIRFSDGLTAEETALLDELDVPEERRTAEDAYAVFGEGNTLVVWSAGLRGKLYGAYTVLQQAQEHDGCVPGGVIFNSPQCPFRGLKVYLPDPNRLDEFYKAVDFLLYYRYNSIIIELGGAMEYKRHPEINESWIEYCAEMGRYPERANEVQTMFGWSKNSIHFENGGGTWLKQETIAGLIAYCKERGLEVIPEVPSLSHADYLLNAHQELAEREYDPFPDVYCPSNPASYDLLFDVMDEVIALFQPKIVHIGHDECYTLGVCERCRGKDPVELYAGDITKIHDFLAQRGVRTMYWSEKMLNAISKGGYHYGGSEAWHSGSRNTKCHIAPTYTAIDRIPKDCIAHNWYWSIVEWGDREFHKRGMPMTFGNWSATGILRWQERVNAGALGGAPSHWTTLSEETLQYNGVLCQLAFGARLLWMEGYEPSQYAELLAKTAEDLFLYKNRETLSKPHFLITHRTTMERPWVYVTSAPMLLEQATVGKYVIEYRSGRTLEIPLIYGLNIMNPRRSWELREDDGIDCYRGDSSLLGMTLTTLPVRRKNGETHFTMAVENPYPGDPVISVRAVKTAEDEGEILLTSFEEEDCAADAEAQEDLQLHY